MATAARTEPATHRDPATDTFDSVWGTFDGLRQYWKVGVGKDHNTASAHGLVGEAFDVVLDAALERLRKNMKAVAP